MKYTEDLQYDDDVAIARHTMFHTYNGFEGRVHWYSTSTYDQDGWGRFSDWEISAVGCDCPDDMRPDMEDFLWNDETMPDWEPEAEDPEPLTLDSVGMRMSDF